MDSQPAPKTEASVDSGNEENALSDEEYFEMLQTSAYSSVADHPSDDGHFEGPSIGAENNEVSRITFLMNPGMRSELIGQLFSENRHSHTIDMRNERTPSSSSRLPSSEHDLDTEESKPISVSVNFAEFDSYRCPQCRHKVEKDSNIGELQGRLVHAIHHNDVDTVRELLQTKGLDPDFDFQNRSPVCRAAATGNIQILNLLLDAGADPNTPNYADLLWERRPVHIAASKGHLSTLQVLVRRGASINQHDSDNRTPLHWVAMYGQDHMIMWMIRAGAGVNLAQTDGFTPLHTATCLGHKEVCRLLLEGGADIACRDRDGWTPLHTAVCYGYRDIVELLIEKGADPLCVTTSNYDSTLHIACSKGNVEIMELLLAKGVPIEAVNSYGSTPLFTAVYYNRLYATYFLIKAGACVNTKNNTGTSPLYLAAIRCEVETLGLLIGAGCFVSKFITLPIILQAKQLSQQMECLASRPLALVDLCFLVIRQALAPALQQRVKQLPLPRSVRRAIAMKDLKFSISDGQGGSMTVASSSDEESHIVRSNGLRFKIVPKPASV